MTMQKKPFFLSFAGSACFCVFDRWLRRKRGREEGDLYLSTEKKKEGVLLTYRGDLTLNVFDCILNYLILINMYLYREHVYLKIFSCHYLMFLL